MNAPDSFSELRPSVREPAPIFDPPEVLARQAS